MSTEFPHIPFIYRLFFLYLEPVMAFNGSILCHWYPTIFLNTMSAAAQYAPSNQVIYDQLAATYVLFAFNEAVLLRTIKDLRVWKTVLVGILLCDSIHLYSMWCVMGTQVFFSPQLWRKEDWVNLALLWGPVVLRSSFLAEVGFKRAHGEKKS
jgi:hypothetical protein